MELTGLLAEVGAATERLVATIGGLGAGDVGDPSLLPGWTRAHALTHIARNGDGGRNLLLGVRSGRRVHMYASPGARVADIEAGAGRPPNVVLADAIESSRRFVIDAECMPPSQWHVEVEFGSATGGAATIPARRTVEMRLREVEMHHVDLGAGYGFADSPAPLVEWLLGDTFRRLAGQGVEVEPVPAGDGQAWVVVAGSDRCTVRGTAAGLLSWVSGRSNGQALQASGALPALPSLG